MAALLHEQLRSAWERSNMSLKELRQAAGLVCSADSLSRKLRGKQVLSIEEADAIAAVFNRKVTMARRRPKAA